MKKLFQSNLENSTDRLKAYEVTYARIICIAAGALYIIVGFLFKIIDKDAIDFLHHRFIIAALFLAIFFGSFKIQKVKDIAKNLSFFVLSISIYWSVWIASLNEFSFNYSLVLITAIAATASIFLNKTLIILFLLTTTIAIFSFLYFTETVGFDLIILPACILILVTTYTIKEYYREQIIEEVNNLNNELSKSNQRLEEKVNQRTTLLKQKNKELEKITYVVSHDLKSPLRNIGSFASLISKKLQIKEYQDIDSYTNIINQAVTSMASLIGDLLQFGKIGQTEQNFVNTDMIKLINNIITTNFSSDEFSDVSIKIAQPFPEEINCIKNQISLVLQNLLSNSIKYNESEIKEIKIFYSDAETHHRIHVQDNGIGINLKYKDQIFEMFSRLHSANQYEGTGIGLAICQKIIYLHQGEINFTSEQGQGTTFWFDIAKNRN